MSHVTSCLPTLKNVKYLQKVGNITSVEYFLINFNLSVSSLFTPQVFLAWLGPTH